MVHPKILVAQGLHRRASSDKLMLHQIGSEPYPPLSARNSVNPQQAETEKSVADQMRRLYQIL
jgi:hypothetical protein